MSSLFDIGRSGLESYRRALAITGQNITNVNTDGYKRREVDLKEVSAGQGDIYSVSSNSGLGVRVSEIKRSFDEFLLNKSRSASSDAESSGAYLAALEQLQSALMPGDGNIGQVLNQFFESLHDVSSVPAELGPRIVAIERGRAVADAFNHTARSLGNLAQGFETQAKQGIDDLNALISGLENINSQLTKTDTGASKSLLDDRDNLIDKISELAKVNVVIDPQGRATLRLGDSLAGPKIIDSARAYSVGITTVDDRLVFKVGALGTEKVTNQLTKGKLGGIATGYNQTAKILDNVNNLAYLVSRDFNEIHKQGVDLDGQRGKDIFIPLRPVAEGSKTNVGQAYAEITISDISKVEADPITFVYSSSKKSWTGTDRFGVTKSTGGSSASLPGMSIKFFGEAFDGDQITIDPSRSAAESMTFALRRGEEIAAAKARLVYADQSNLTKTIAYAKDTAGPTKSSISEISQVFGNNIASISATEFLSDGVAAIIPPKTKNVDIASLSQQGVYKFNIADDELPDVNSMSLTFSDTNNNSSTVTFNLDSQTYSNSEGGIWEDAEDIAFLMNIGAISATHSDGRSGVTLADLGGYASAKGGTIVVNLANDSPSSGSITTSSGSVITPEITPKNSVASTIQVFTREGRHVAGEVLDQAAQASFLTTANGFLANATYNSDYLNSPSGYRGMNIVRREGAAENLIDANLNGSKATFDFRRLTDVDGSFGANNGSSAHAESASYTLNIEGYEYTVTSDDFGLNATHEDVAASMLKKFRDAAPIATLAGSAVSPITADGKSVAIEFEGQNYSLTMVNGEVIVSGGEEGRITAFFSNDNKLYISSNSGTISADPITVLDDSVVSGNTEAATAFGLTVGVGPIPTAAGFTPYDFTLSISGSKITASHNDTSATLTATTQASSAIGERVILKDVPEEELIIMLSGGARRLAASYDMHPDSAPSVDRDFSVKILDATARTVEFIDTASGTSIANRTLDVNQKAEAYGIEIELIGQLSANDQFHITSNNKGSGDSRNLIDLTSLQSPQNGKGGFQDVFAGIISRVGSTLQSTSVSYDAAKELHNSSVEIESAFSGVSLDNEAARLIQQQQAYQASARILMTAREIFQTLLDAV